MTSTLLNISEQVAEWVDLVDHPVLKMLLLAISAFISEDLACILGGVLAANGQLIFPLTVTGCVLGLWTGYIPIYRLSGGVTAEPAHIYQPGFSLIGAWKALIHQWQSAVECGRENLTRGQSRITLTDLYSLFRLHSKKQNFEADGMNDC
ncbi:MAG: hypothetical protein ACI9E1_002286 [Cryomorphaceae bacterium]|jgi:hypothetical protein